MANKYKFQRGFSLLVAGGIALASLFILQAVRPKDVFGQMEAMVGAEAMGVGAEEGEAEAKTSSQIYDLLSEDGKIFLGAEPNSIMVIDYPENVQRVEEYLQMVDVPAQQVLIEARVVEVHLKSQDSLGITWSITPKAGRTWWWKPFGNVPRGIGDWTINPPSQQIPYKYTTDQGGANETPFSITIFNEHINIVLQALANNYDTNLLSAPSIATLNNRKAKIEVVKKLPWAEPTVTTTDTGVTITWEINFEEEGISLTVQPTISEDGTIVMDLVPEVSEKVGDYSLTAVADGQSVNYSVPIIDKRKAETRVIIRDGQTLIIGGLIKDKVIKDVTKVPLLGDLPIIKHLFRSKKDTKDKIELLIFVSPTIVREEEITRMAREERYGVGQWYMEDREEKEKEKARKEARELRGEELKEDMERRAKERQKQLVRRKEELLYKRKKRTAEREALNLAQEKIKERQRKQQEREEKLRRAAEEKAKLALERLRQIERSIRQEENREEPIYN